MERLQKPIAKKASAMRTVVPAILLFTFVLFAAKTVRAQSPSSASDLAPGSAQLINPDELLTLLQSTTGEKPLAAERWPFAALYAGPHSRSGIHRRQPPTSRPWIELRARVKSLPHDKLIVLYCGCCPWSHCPNVRPAYNQLNAMGFSHVKVLYIANNFGTDWVDKGYPTIKGQ